MQIEEKVIGILNEARDHIQRQMEEKNINATGRTSQSIKVRTIGSRIQLVGGGENTAPFESIEIGRGAGGDYKVLRPRIFFWTIAKNMDFVSDSHRWAVSTNIAKNIVEHGTRRHRQHEDIYSTYAPKVADEIEKMLNEEFKNAFGLLIGKAKANTNF